MKHRIVSCLLVMVMAISMIGSMALAQGAEPMGRYVESRLPMPDAEQDNIIGLRPSADGLLRVLVVGGGKVTPFEWDGQIWAASGNALNVSDFGRLVQLGDIAYASLYEFDDAGGLTSYFAQFIDGEPEPIALDVDINMADRMAIAENGTLLVQLYEEAILAFDGNTHALMYRFDGMDGAFTVQGNALIGISRENRSVRQYDLATGEMSCEMKEAPVMEDDVIASDGQSVYLGNRGGLYRIASGGVIWEQLVSGNLTSLGEPSLVLREMAVYHSDIYVIVYQNDAASILRYSFDANVSTLPRQELHVATLHESEMLTQAASIYQKQHPDSVVNIKVLLPEGIGITRNDAIQTLNTELLSGKGPDVLFMDGMKVSNYADKGLLGDISHIISELNAQGELIMPLFAPFMEEGRSYAVPTSVMLPVLIGKEDNISGLSALDDLVTFIENAGSDTPMIYRTKKDYFRMFMPASFPAWFDGSGQMNEGAFAAYLVAIDAIHKKIAQPDSAEQTQSQMGYEHAVLQLNEAIAADGDDIEMYTPYAFPYEHARLRDGRTLIYPDTVGSFFYNMILMTTVSEMSGTLGFMPGQAERVFEPRGMLGINARSAQIGAAEDFVRAMLSQEVQDVASYETLPVNAKALAVLVGKDESSSGMTASFTDPETGINGRVGGFWPVGEVRERISALLHTVKTPSIPDTTLVDMMLTELEPYFEGTMVADAAVQTVASKVRAYLAE